MNQNKTFYKSLMLSELLQGLTHQNNLTQIKEVVEAQKFLTRLWSTDNFQTTLNVANRFVSCTHSSHFLEGHLPYSDDNSQPDPNPDAFVI